MMQHMFLVDHADPSVLYNYCQIVILVFIVLFFSSNRMKTRFHVKTNTHHIIWEMTSNWNHLTIILYVNLYLSISQMWRFGGNTWFPPCNSRWAVSPQAGGPTKWWAGLWTLGYKQGAIVHYFSTNSRQAAAVRAVEDLDSFLGGFGAVHWSRNTSDTLRNTEKWGLCITDTLQAESILKVKRDTFMLVFFRYGTRQH